MFTQPRKSSWPPDLALCAICLKNLPRPLTPRTSFSLLTASNTEDSSSWSLKLCLSGQHKHFRHEETRIWNLRERIPREKIVRSINPTNNAKLIDLSFHEINNFALYTCISKNTSYHNKYIFITRR